MLYLMFVRLTGSPSLTSQHAKFAAISAATCAKALSGIFGNDSSRGSSAGLCHFFRGYFVDVGIVGPDLWGIYGEADSRLWRGDLLDPGPRAFAAACRQLEGLHEGRHQM